MALGDGGLKLELDFIPDDEVRLETRLLGSRPYLLVEVKPSDDGETVVFAGQAGGGAGSVDDLKQLVGMLTTLLDAAPNEG